MRTNDFRRAARPRHLAAAALAACCASLPIAVVAADAYPSKPITMVVPYPPGGPTDIVARLVAAEMSKTIGQNIVVDGGMGRKMQYA